MSETKKNIVLRILFNPIVKSILLMAVILVLLIVGVLFWLKSYTKHNESITVPKVKGLQVEDAAGIFKSNYLAYEVIDSLYLNDGVPGSIVEQIPQENLKVKKGRTVYLVIQAKGKQLVAIPSLRDYSQRQAEAQLMALGFSNVVVDEVPSQYKGLVIDVYYQGRPLNAGEKVPKGSPLRMKVGGGGVAPTDTVPYGTIPAQNNSTPDLDQSFFN